MDYNKLQVIAMKKLIFIQIILSVFYSLPVFCQNDTIIDPYSAVDTLQNDFGLFSKDEILNVSLRFDITYYTRNKSKDEYLNALLTYHISKNDSINKEIKLKSRGEFRNKYCQFPPLSLNFKKTEFSKADLNKIQKIKLVTHCESGNEDYLLREYLIYKLYNVLTPNSFRVRMLKINYINTNKKRKPIIAYGFLIEPIEILSERTNSTPVDMINLNQKNILPEMMDRVAIFNYMIGNTDWSVPGQHNCKVLARKEVADPELGMIVPYDFDYSGLVNAYYAIPYEPLGLKSVRERRYLGICRNEDIFINALKEFKDNKEEFYRIINEFQLLSAKSKKDMTGYLDTFYERFNNRNSIVSDLLGECKNF
jgi:hypothetical protein